MANNRALRPISNDNYNVYITLHCLESDNGVDKGPSISVINTVVDDDDSSAASSGGHGEDKKEGEDDDEVNNGYVKVETKAVPTSQHPTKVVCSPEHIQLPLPRHMDINDTFSDDNSTRAELGSNPDERSILSDTVEPSEAVEVVNSTDMEDEDQTINCTGVIVSPTANDDDDDNCGTPKGVVVLSSSVAVTSTMSVVRPRSAPQSKLRRVLPADTDRCYSNHEPNQVMIRHKSHKSVPEAVNPVHKDMHKYASLPTKSKYLGVDRAMAGTNGHAFTVLNSFKDSREAIDEIWKSVTLEGSSQLERTDEVETSSSTNSPHSSHLAVNGSDVNVSNIIYMYITNYLVSQYDSPMVNGDISNGVTSLSEAAASKGVL